MLKFVDSRTEQSSVPSHPSYYNRPVPALQLAAAASKFNPTINKQDFDPNVFSDDIKTNPPVITRPNTAVGALFNPSDNNVDTSDMNIQSKRKISNNATKVQNGLIGGIESDDRWTTTAQNYDSSTLQNKKNSKKKSFGNSDIISPITGQPVADYGNWRNDLANKQRSAIGNNNNGNSNDAELTGVDAIAAKLRQQLASHGAHGIIGLGRKFRIMDDDGNNSLSFSEFTKAMKECEMNLSQQELKDLFNYFDMSKQGAIRYDDFIDAIAGQMNPRRINLVNMAFDILDADGNGFVEPVDIAKLYNASKHPDVISGKRTAAEVLREFLDGFDVGGEVDGKVTRQEFQNYYRKISASIDNDNYFELMIRNAWHISGGEGESANTANRRVLVTKADGTQVVQEIKNDLGLGNDDKAGMISRLKLQGVDANNIDLYGDAGDKNISLGKPKPTTLNSRSSNQLPRTVQPQMNNISSSNVNLSRTSPAASSSSQNGRPNTSAKSTSAPIASTGIQFLINKLKTAMKSRGANGFIGLQRLFRIMDDDGNKTLSLPEFKKAMKEMKLEFNETELRLIFDFFDSDHSGSIDFEEFVQGIRDPLSDRRLKLVDLAFDIIDVDGNGIVDAAEIAQKYDASKHPDVLAGRKNSREVLTEFLKTFDVGGEVDGKVTRQEFTNYYTNIGASIDNDNYFELMIRNAWHISGGEGEAANTANRRVLVTNSDGTQSVQEISNDLGLKSDDKAGMISRLKAQGINANNIDLYGDAGDKNMKPMTYPYRPSTSTRNQSQLQPQQTQQFDLPKGLQSGPPPLSSKRPNTSNNKFAYTTPVQTIKSMMSNNNPLLKTQPIMTSPNKILTVNKQPIANEPSAGMKYLLDKLKAEIKSRGGIGFIGLQKQFALMDDDGSKSLSLVEFKKAMKEFNIPVKDNELRLLFDYFDSDHSGTIDFEEFIQGIRDPLSPERLSLVKLAFSLIDIDGNGIVDGDEIAQRYDPSQHPEVLAGRKTARAVLSEFLKTFEIGGEVDGKVTEQEFINYYTNIGASIDNDNYFELMIRNAWHIEGGIGQAANSSNRRVLVTKADGSQEVATINNDLGLRSDDKSGMLARLQAQGINANSIELFNQQDLLKRGKLDIATETVETLENNIKELKAQAALAYNRGDYTIAQKNFTDILEYLKKYLNPKHPLILKIEKSLDLVKNKIISINEVNSQKIR